ncbi:MAG: helix-turn-helix domain-containing protein [Bacteroidales bacterium]|nr:helix-turn-helix domain-containing protein [Bacteroidales bacterium]MCD8394541.1 helix-turn-helix domain-containing protein [Bacteroidales bacterium]
MDIVNRLKFFLDQQGLTSSQFADACRIPRPTLSQLLTGRNKKVSDEIFAKIHEAYPQLSILWLMFGEGQPVTGTGPTTSSVATQGGLAVDNGSSPIHSGGDFPELGSSTPEMTAATQGMASRGMIDFGNSLFDTDPTDFGADQHQTANTQSGTGVNHPLSQLGSLASGSANAANANGANGAVAGENVPGTISISPDATKKITSIVVFYNDNSFQSFAPTA